MAASGVTAVTDVDGRFLLRNLPAGENAIGVTTVTPLPDGLTAPVGRVRLPADPIQLIDATIIIDNPRLLEFITSDGRGTR